MSDLGAQRSREAASPTGGQRRGEACPPALTGGESPQKCYLVRVVVKFHDTKIPKTYWHGKRNQLVTRPFAEKFVDPVQAHRIAGQWLWDTQVIEVLQ